MLGAQQGRAIKYDKMIPVTDIHKRHEAAMT